jgi:polymorphic membrane protein
MLGNVILLLLLATIPAAPVAAQNPSSGGAGGGTPTWKAGNPNGSCSAGMPTRAQVVSTSNPTTVVGTGTASSCTFAALQAAVTAGGIITFNCGANPLTILVTATLNVPSNKNTVIDGGRKITLDGGGAVQIMRFYSGNFQANDTGLTLQHIAMINGKTTPTEMIPPAPAPCSQGYNDGEGGALYLRDGYLVVVDSIFSNNQGASLGPDTGGGAIYVLGSKGGVWISNSTFTNNAASNAGAVGGLFAQLNIYNSLFIGNRAVGHDANNHEPDKCSALNNGQNETGSGGNGGAIYSDGNDVNVTLCGDAILNNAAGVNAFGGGLFFTSNNFRGTLTIADTTMIGNTGGYWTQVRSGSVTDAGTAVGTNCESITITNSRLQRAFGRPRATAPGALITTWRGGESCSHSSTGSSAGFLGVMPLPLSCP